MKMRLLSFLLVAVLVGTAMTGCRAGGVGQRVKTAGTTAERGTAAPGDQLKQSMETNMASRSTWPVNPVLTPEEGKQIALNHAGLTADLVIGLRAEYEIEHGTPIYDVEFRHGNWEYDYEIHADTGEILSFSKND